MRFLEFFRSLKENSINDKTLCMTFGRFNPVSIAHKGLFTKMSEMAKNSNCHAFIFTSQTNGKTKNPLTYEDKIHYIKVSIEKLKNTFVIENEDIKTIFDCFEHIKSLGYKNVNIVVGSDRKKDFDRISKYKDSFGFSSINVFSIGNREEELAMNFLDGVSSTKMREFVKNNKIEEFIKMSGLSNNRKEAMNMYHDVYRSRLR